MKKKMNIMVIFITIIISLFCLSLVIYLLLTDNSNNKQESTVENKIYGTVLELGANYVKIKTIDDKKYIVFTDEKINEGDFIVAYYKKGEDSLIKTTSVEVIASNDEIIIPATNELTTSTSTSEVTTTSKANATNKVTETTTTAQRTTNYSEETTTVVNNNMEDYFSNEYQSINYDETDVNHKEIAKQKFIDAVDFIFYGKSINGVTFASLSNKVKAKVLYYTILMDSKIENIYPNYKENMGTKYNDIKSILLAKYMDLVINVCNDNESNCDSMRSDFELLKKSVNLTWSVLKKAFQYAYNKGTSALVDWYEVFSGKR